MNDFFTLISNWFHYIFNQITSMSVTDVIDIALVSIIFFYIYKFIRERRAGKLITGVLVLIAMLLLSQFLNMYVLQFLLENIIQVGLIAVIIVFQPELRSALEKVGGEPFKSLKNIGEQKSSASVMNMIDILCEASCELSKTKTGALIVIERSTKLGDIAKTGTILNADVSTYLLRNIFYDKAPLHDGAVVISDARIYSAGCFLPLSSNAEMLKGVGTRHRAALGMSENSDALIIVVSEETGIISIALSGKLTRNYNNNTLKEALTFYLCNDKGSGKIFKKRKFKN